MLVRFQEKAEAVSSEVHRFGGKREALAFIMDFLRKEGNVDHPGSWAVWPDGAFLREMKKDPGLASLPGLKFDVSRELAARAKIGISEMDWALADTGTLVQGATSVEQRLASTLPEIHVAIIGTERILPDMATLLSKISPRDTAYLTFITGPSRTADIERVLTIGVHGPERLIILLVDKEIGGAA